MSSTCVASSSIVCWASSAAPVRRACSRTSLFQSCGGMACPLGVLDAGNLAEGGDETAPVGPLLRQDAAPGFRDAVMATAPLAGLFNPAPLDPAAVLEAVQRGVE